jgi:hypothetical protein
MRLTDTYLETVARDFHYLLQMHYIYSLSTSTEWIYGATFFAKMRCNQYWSTKFQDKNEGLEYLCTSATDYLKPIESWLVLRIWGNLNKSGNTVSIHANYCLIVNIEYSLGM